MYPTTDIHSLDTWLALFDQDVERTTIYGDALAARIDKLGIMVDPALITSLAAYQQAQQRWTETASAHTSASATDPALSDRAQPPCSSAYPDCLQWLTLTQDAPLDALTFVMPETPTVNEWLVLIQHDPVQAQQHVKGLQDQVVAFDDFVRNPHIHTVEEFRQARHLHIGAEQAMSIENYQTAQQVIAGLGDQPISDTRLTQRLRLGRATLTAYPDQNEWLVLFTAEPAFTRALRGELGRKAAVLGLAAPCVLSLSIADAQKLLPPAPSQPLSTEMRELFERIRQGVQDLVEAADNAREILRRE
jgi:hypothetical protein